MKRRYWKMSVVVLALLLFAQMTPLAAMAEGLENILLATNPEFGVVRDEYSIDPAQVRVDPIETTDGAIQNIALLLQDVSVFLMGYTEGNAFAGAAALLGHGYSAGNVTRFNSQPFGTINVGESSVAIMPVLETHPGKTGPGVYATRLTRVIVDGVDITGRLPGVISDGITIGIDDLDAWLGCPDDCGRVHLIHAEFELRDIGWKLRMGKVWTTKPHNETGLGFWLSDNDVYKEGLKKDITGLGGNPPAPWGWKGSDPNTYTEPGQYNAPYERHWLTAGEYWVVEGGERQINRYRLNEKPNSDEDAFWRGIIGTLVYEWDEFGRLTGMWIGNEVVKPDDTRYCITIDVRGPRNSGIVHPEGVVPGEVKTVQVLEGNDLTVTVVPYPGHAIASIVVEYADGTRIPQALTPEEKLETYSFTLFEIRQNCTVYVVFSDAIEYEIHYVLDGGTYDPVNPNPSTYTVADTPIPIVNPTKRGYRFTGWTVEYANPALTDIDTPVMAYEVPSGATGDITLTATWVQISFDLKIIKEWIGGISLQGFVRFVITGNGAVYDADRDEFTPLGGGYEITLRESDAISDLVWSQTVALTIYIDPANPGSGMCSYTITEHVPPGFTCNLATRSTGSQ